MKYCIAHTLVLTFLGVGLIEYVWHLHGVGASQRERVGEKAGSKCTLCVCVYVYMDRIDSLLFFSFK